MVACEWGSVRPCYDEPNGVGIVDERAVRERGCFQIVKGGLAALVAGLMLGWGVKAHAEGYGPFPTRNFQPIQLLVLGMFGDRAAVLKKGTLDLRIEMADTSTIFDDQTPPTTATMKFEQVRSGLFLRYGLTNQLEVGVEVPALYRYPGILGGMISQVERLTSGLAPARAALKNQGFVYNLTKNGRTLISGRNGDLGLGDITLFSKYQVLSESQGKPAVSLRLAVKAPSGDSGRFFGSGHTDVGFGLAVEKMVAAHWILYGNLNGIFPTGSIAGLTLQPAMSGIVAAEYLWSPAVSLVAQFDYYSTPFHGTGTPVLDQGVTEVAAGFNYRLRNNLLWQVYGVENLDFIRGGAADFTLSTVVTYRFGN